jgi:hypothetical protein
VLAALGFDANAEDVSDEETARRYTGALLFVRGLRRLDQLSNALTSE